MMRKHVSAAVRKAAEKMNYAFGAGFEYRINQSVTQLPALWLAPPKLINVKGRKECTAEYSVRIVLMAAGARKSEEQKEAVWNSLENDALAICREIQNYGRVTAVDSVACEPGEFSLTNHGELSMAVTFRIGIADCSCEE